MAVDWSRIYKKHRGQWVALTRDEKTVIASGRTAKAVWNEAKKKGYRKPILTRMPKKLVSYVGRV